MKAYIYYPGPIISIVLLILNLSHVMDFNLWWLIVPLWFGWFGFSEGDEKLPELPNVVWFPLIKKFLKKIE